MPSSAKSSVKPLSIAIVYDDSLDGHEGVAHQVKLIGSWLSGRGHKVSYLCGQTKLTQYEGSKIYSLARNIKVSFNGNKMSVPMPGRRSAIVQALKAANPDVLHVQTPHSPFLAQRVVNISKAPAVGTFHIYPANWVARVGAKLLRLAYFGGLNRFNEFVSVSSAAQDFAAKSFGIKTSIVPNAVNIAELKSSLKNKPLTVVFLGRLVERKGCEQLIRAFAIVRHHLPDARLIIGGKGPEQTKLEKLAEQLHIEANVKFEGFINEADKADFLAQGTVACFPSLYGESFGIVLVEAMAAGAGSVIAGNNPGYASVMEPRTDLLCDPTNAEALAQQIIKLLSDSNFRAGVSAWQKQYVKQFDINTVGAEIEALYTRAIAKSGNKRHNDSK